MKVYVVKYSGSFGFIKPWTAVRDEEVFSQQFLTPAIVAGIERKLFPELLKEDWGIFKIIGNRLTYSQISQQQEQTQSRGFNSGIINKEKYLSRGTFKNNKLNFATITRGVLNNPTLFIVFKEIEDAEKASKQHICLARNEDILYPETDIIETTIDEFNENEEIFNGFELVFEENDDSFLVGYNRYNNNEPMYGWLRIVGNPVKSYY